MKSFFSFLSGLTFFVMIIGLIKPTLFQKLFKKEKVSRSKILGISIILVIIFSVLSTDYSSSNVSNTNSSSTSSGANGTVNNEPVEPEYLLELKSYKCYEEYGYFQITGEVMNISDHSLDNIEAIGGAYTKEGEFVKSDSALIEYNPIMPGQTSPFKVMTTMNPLIHKCNIDFKSLMGGTIATKKTEK